jgi:hypothetical protein
MTPQGGFGAMRPHRGTLILVLGILGLVLCVICAIVAWVMGSGDLKEMDAGRMDPSGRGLTQAGKIIGIIAVILNVIFILFYVVLIVIVGIGAAAGAASNP